MIQIVFESYLLLLLFLTGETICFCQDSYLNLCGSNYTEAEDFENSACDCSEVIFCSVIELSDGCNVTTLELNLNVNTTLLEHLQCDVSPLESQVEIPTCEILNQTGNQIIIEILSKSDFGKFKITSRVNEFIPPVAEEWEVVDVVPTEVVVDSVLKLRVIFIKKAISQTPAWCFINTSDNNLEVLSTSWISDTQIECLGFNPVVPGLFKVALGSVISSSTFEKSATVKVTSKHPIPQKAEYGLDFQTIFIYFDENIDLHSGCGSVFPKETHQKFGMKFNCSTRGNILIVKMGPQFQFADNITIAPGNKIYRAGSQGEEFCLPALPASLPISKQKIADPSLSLYLNSECDNSAQKHLSIKVMPSKQPQPITKKQTFQTNSRGNKQRKNIILWRMMRQIQKKFSSRRVILPTNPEEVGPLLENVSLLDGFLDTEDSDFNASVTILVQSSPATASVLAEAVVSFCENSVKLFQYRWAVNGKDVIEDGKLLTLTNLLPGKYVFKCSIINYNSTEVLGQGLATTEILPSNEKILIIPSEITVSAAEDISLHAVTDQSAPVSWTCKTALGKVCVTVDQKSVSEIIDLNSHNISVPAGTLPLGEYVWTVESKRGSNEAKVVIKPGNVTIRVEVQFSFVEPGQEVVLHGSVKQMKRGCHTWWSSVRQKGFNYLRIRDVEGNEEASSDVEQIPLVITSEDWKNAEPDSSYVFKLQVLCPDGSLNYLKVPVRLSNPPRASSLTVEPLTGKAMVTEFLISEVDADTTGEDYPLVYEWSYVDTCGVEVPFKRGAFLSNYTTYLPPGDLKIILKVCDAKKLCSVTSSSLISVIQESEFPTENFHRSLTQIEYLTTSGDVVEGFGLAITILRSLALLAETEIREKVFTTVEGVISTKMRDLIKKTESDSNAAKSSLEFLERAAEVAKYFRKGSDILIRLKEFRVKLSRKISKVNLKHKK